MRGMTNSSHSSFFLPSRERIVATSRLARALASASCACVLATLSVASALAAPPVSWPQWRGPGGQGHANAAKDLAVEFGDKEGSRNNVVWKAELPGRGWSTPVLAGDEIWMTTAIETPLSEEEKKARKAGNTGDQALNISGPISMRAICVDRVTGKILANIELLTEPKPDPIHALNSYASPSPILENGKLYCCFGTNGLACVDTEKRKIAWTTREHRLQHENGPGSTPVLWNELLIFHCDGSDVQYITALDKHSGRTVWKTARSGELNANPQLKKAYGTPLVLQLDGRPLVVSPGADWLYGYDPATGAEQWKASYGVLGFSIVPCPVEGNGMLFMSTSFMQAEILAWKLGDGRTAPELAWRFKKQAPQMPSPLLVGDELYIVNDRGVATCLDAKTGEVHWSERLGGNFCSSPLLADGRIYVGNREGQMFVFAPGKKYSPLAVNQLDGAIMASPLAVGSGLYVRTDKALYRIEKGAAQP